MKILTCHATYVNIMYTGMIFLSSIQFVDSVAFDTNQPKTLMPCYLRTVEILKYAFLKDCLFRGKEKPQNLGGKSFLKIVVSFNCKKGRIWKRETSQSLRWTQNLLPIEKLEEYKAEYKMIQSIAEILPVNNVCVTESLKHEERQSLW